MIHGTALLTTDLLVYMTRMARRLTTLHTRVALVTIQAHLLRPNQHVKYMLLTPLEPSMNNRTV